MSDLEVKREIAKRVDRVKAKQRMRRLRFQTGGATRADVARRIATQRLIANHRDEFETYLREGQRG